MKTQQSWQGSLVFEFYLDRVRAEGFLKELLNVPPKNEIEILIYSDSNEPRKNTDKDLMNL